MSSGPLSVQFWTTDNIAHKQGSNGYATFYCDGSCQNNLSVEQQQKKMIAVCFLSLV